TVKVRIALGVKDTRIVPDMGVRVSFLEEAGQAPTQGAWVPTRAVVGAAGDASVFIVEDQRARRVAIGEGETRDSDRLALIGLRGGEQVVLSPPADLRDGDRVRVKTP
ncbi:MAG: efflux RND transporter periplasmic adaptor subunit, partial [Gammaproteobacteria bacterium HGW-Gammaproteobacteria-7]